MTLRVSGWEATINKQTRFDPGAGYAAQPRARGDARLSVRARTGRTVLDGLRVSGSLKLVFPRQHGQAMDGVLVNTAGGITGGDRFGLSAGIGTGAHLVLTTQAAERAYRAQPGETGTLTTRISVARGGCLHWLPQETILFDGAAYSRALRIDLETDASLLLVEPLVFGRAAMGEEVRNAAFHDRIDILQDGRRRFSDRISLSGDIHAHLCRPFIADGAGAMAIVVAIGPESACQLDRVRRLLTPTSGASLIDDDLLVVRCLASDGYALRQTLVPVLKLLSGTDLPKCWML